MKGTCTTMYPGTTYGGGGGGENPLTIHEISAALTPSDSRSDWASESAAAAESVSVLIKEGVFFTGKKSAFYLLK